MVVLKKKCKVQCEGNFSYFFMQIRHLERELPSVYNPDNVITTSMYKRSLSNQHKLQTTDQFSVRLKDNHHLSQCQELLELQVMN